MMASRLAIPEDAAQIVRIYNQAIEERSATFEVEQRTEASVRGWFDGSAPIIVVEDSGALIAFAAASRWKQRDWFRGVHEVAVYVDRAHRGRGAGRRALEELIKAARSAGFWKLLGAAFTTNAGSRALMRASAFREVGIYEKQGKLDGQWRDVLLFEKLLVENVLPRTVIFACVHNAGRSQMAAAVFNELADPKKAHALSAGTQPGQRVHPEVVSAMRELDLDLSSASPRKLTAELAKDAFALVTMGCGDDCPAVPGARREDWPLPDPKGKPVEEVRRIRDELRRRVAAMVDDNGWMPRE